MNSTTAAKSSNSREANTATVTPSTLRSQKSALGALACSVEHFHPFILSVPNTNI